MNIERYPMFSWGDDPSATCTGSGRLLDRESAGGVMAPIPCIDGSYLGCEYDI